MPDLEHTDLTAPDGTRIRRWARIPSDPSGAVLFVHGATYGGRSAFDPPGYSWLEAVAARGRAAYAVDLRGYGDSAQPPALDAPPAANDPVVRGSTAARDVVAAAADLPAPVHLVGYSWGTIVAGLALTAEELAVASLVQYAPVYHPPERLRERFSPGDPPAAYRRVAKAEARRRWADQRPDGTVPADAFEAFWAVLAESGQLGDDEEILAPNGTLVDLTAAVDDPLYDADAIDVPALVVRGSQDTASTRGDALACYDALGGADRTYAELAGGTHFLQFEGARTRLYDAVGTFQDRVGPT